MAAPLEPDPKTFRRVMGLFATGVTVVAAQAGDRTHAMTANAVMSVSLDPLLICVSIDRRAKMSTFIEEAGGFCVSILRAEQQALSQFFAGLWPHPSPPEYTFQPWVGGPRLQGCLAAVGCRIHEILEGGDHRLVLGRALALYQGEGVLRPLVFYGGRYHSIPDVELPPRDPVEVWVPELTQIFYGE